MYCYTFIDSTTENEVDTNGINNSSMEVLDMVAFQVPPDIVYRQLNATHYQWCGPFLHMAEYFAKFTNTR